MGWDVKELNGDKIEDILNAFETVNYSNKKPHLLIAHTTKGKGVSFMEGIPLWHHKIPSVNQYEHAVLEITERIEKLKKN